MSNIEYEIVYQDVVTASECGWVLELSPVGAFQRVQNAMTFYFGKMELDSPHLNRRHNATWVVTRNKIEFWKALKWNDHFCAKCRVIGKSTARTILNIGLFNDEGQLCISSRMEMCALALDTKRVRKLSEIGFDVMELQSEYLESCFDKISANGLESVASRRITLSNLDFNQHTNNVEYTRFLMDTYTLDDVKDKHIQSFQIDYVNQSRLGDELTICKGRSDHKDTIVIRNGDTVVVRSQIEWSGSAQ